MHTTVSCGQFGTCPEERRSIHEHSRCGYTHIQTPERHASLLELGAKISVFQTNSYNFTVKPTRMLLVQRKPTAVNITMSLSGFLFWGEILISSHVTQDPQRVHKAWGNGSVPRKCKASNENVIAPEHPSAYLPAIVWGSLSTHQLYPGSFNMQPSFDSVQENKFVDLLPHLIESLHGSCLFIHYRGESL